MQSTQHTHTKYVHLFWLVSILFFSCTWQTEPKPYRERLPTDTVADLLIDEYEVRFGDLSERCEQHLHSVVYVERGERIYTDSDFALGLDKKLKGEHYYDDIHYIWIKKSLTPMQYNGTLTHELIHVLLSCLSDTVQQGIGDGDNDHNEPDIWCTSVNGIGYGCHFDGKDDTNSLEYTVAEMVRYYVK